MRRIKAEDDLLIKMRVFLVVTAIYFVSELCKKSTKANEVSLKNLCERDSLPLHVKNQ